MTEKTKTISFVVVAAVLSGAAAINHFVNQPRASSDFELVGQPFYESFDSTANARSLEVAALDPETGRQKQFSVKQVKGLWRIPSEYNYPAEAAARLAETASSVMGLNRETLVGRQSEDHARFGVVDPLDEEIDDPATAGKRITIKDVDDEPIADFIIGNESEDAVVKAEDRPFQTGEGKQKSYYVRRADEQQTYSVPLKIDLSTKFSDWINPDLLQIESSELTQINIRNYTVAERGAGLFGTKELVKSETEELLLTRPEDASEWEFVGLKPETESLQTDRVGEMVDALDSMELVGVRPRFKVGGESLLTPDLGLAKIDALEKDPQRKGEAIAQLQADLASKGFNFGGTAEQLQLVSENGELDVDSSAGVRYRLNIGGKVAIEDDAIDIGDSEEADASDAGDAESKIAEEVPNRYLFVRAQFVESLLGPEPDKPTEPTEPVKPEGYEPAAPAEPDAKLAESDEAESEAAGDETGSDEAGSDDAEAKDEADDEEDTESQTPSRDPAFAAYDEAMAAFEQTKIDYELGLSRYEVAVKERAEQIVAGKARVKELNERFGDWFYVVAGENLNVLQSTRSDLVEIKEPPTQMPPGAGAAGEAKIPAMPPSFIGDEASAEAPSPDPEATEAEADTDMEAEPETESAAGDEAAADDMNADADPIEPAAEGEESEPAYTDDSSDSASSDDSAVDAADSEDSAATEDTAEPETQTDAEPTVDESDTSTDAADESSDGDASKFEESKN